MSHRRKHVTSSVLTETVIPQGGQLYGKVANTEGSGLFQVETPDGTLKLSLLPTKFHGVVFVRNGTFVVIEPLDEDTVKGKVSAEICHVYLPQHIKELKRQGEWPNAAAFNGGEEKKEEKEGNGLDEFMPPSDDSSDGENDAVFVNPNLQGSHVLDDDTSEDEDEDEHDEDDDK